MRLLCFFLATFVLQCQTDTFAGVNEAVAELSQITGLRALKKVEYDTISKEQFKRYLEETLQKQVKPEDVRIQELVLKRFGLVPDNYNLMESTVDLLTEQAAAFYDYRRRKLFLMEGGDAAAQPMLLVHELAHALADQHFDLNKFIKQGKNDDAALARIAVMEGQATWLMMESGARKLGQSMLAVPGMAARMEGTADQLGNQFPVLASAPLYVRESLLFPYRAGFRFQHELLEKLGSRAYAQVFESPPVSTQQVLHPEKYLAALKPIELPAPSFNGRNYRELSTGIIGEFDFAVLFEQYLGKATASQLAPAWRGGNFRLLEGKKTRQVVLLYVSEWADARQAREAFAAHWKIAQGKSKQFKIVSQSDTAFEASGDYGPIRIELNGTRVSGIEGATAGVSDRLN